MALKLKGSTSGFVALDAPSAAGNNTLILPKDNGSALQILGNHITAGVVTFTSVTVNPNGDMTVPGTISVGGTVTYEDVTNVDSVGIVTAGKGVRITSGGLNISGITTGLSVSGVGTFNGSVGIGTDTPSSILESRGTAATYTNASTVFTGNTTNAISGGKNGIGLYSYGDALKGGLSSNLLYSNSATPSQSSATRSSGQIEFSNTTVATKTSRISFGGYYKGTTTFIERMRINNDGRLLIGDDTARTHDGGNYPAVQVASNASGNWARIASTAYIDSEVGGGLILSHSRNGTIGSHTVVQDQDKLGSIFFEGSDGNTFERGGAIHCKVNGTPGDDDMPGALTFETTKDGTSTLVERMRIAHNGGVVIGNTSLHSGATSQYSKFAVAGNTTNANAAIITLSNGVNTAGTGDDDNLGYIIFGDMTNGEYSWIRGAVDGAPATGDYPGRIEFATTADAAAAPTERMRITSTGKVGINRTDPDGMLSVSEGTGSISATQTLCGEFRRDDGTRNPRLQFLHNQDGSIIKHTYTTAASAMMFMNPATERMRIDGTGDGNVTIKTGDLIMGTNDKGLSFANSSSAPDSNSTSSTRRLTDYDEGTCDWELHRDGGATTGANAAVTRVAYTKIGNRVFMSGYVYTQNTGSATGVVAILTNSAGGNAELPYTPVSAGGMPIIATRTLNEYERMSVSFASGSRTVYVHTDESNNEYTPDQNDVTISSSQTHLVLAFTGSYETDD